MNGARGAALVTLLLLVAGGEEWIRHLDREVKTPVYLPQVAYETSKPCAMCHPGHFESWHRTFHRTMTQVASAAAVVGDFDDASLDYQGVTSRFTREGDRYFIETLSPDGAMT